MSAEEKPARMRVMQEKVLLAAYIEQWKLGDSTVAQLRQVLGSQRTLDNTQSQLLVKCFKMAVGRRIKALRVVTPATWRSLINRRMQDVVRLQEFKTMVESQLQIIYEECQHMIVEELLPHESTPLRRVFWLHARGDLSRVFSTAHSGEPRQAALRQSRDAFEKALAIAQTALPPAHLTRLLLSLSYATLLCEALKDRYAACLHAFIALRRAEVDKTTLASQPQSAAIVRNFKILYMDWLGSLSPDDKERLKTDAKQALGMTTPTTPGTPSRPNVTAESSRLTMAASAPGTPAASSGALVKPVLADVMVKVNQNQALTEVERQVVVTSYKAAVDERRRRLAQMQQQASRQPSDELEQRIVLLKEEIFNICRDFSRCLREHLIPSEESPETLVLYYNLKGDYNRYIVLVSTAVRRKTAIEQACGSYETGLKIALDRLPVANSVRLGLVLNYSLFLESIRDTKYAIELVAKTLQMVSTVKLDPTAAKIVDAIKQNFADQLADLSDGGSTSSSEAVERLDSHANLDDLVNELRPEPKVAPRLQKFVLVSDRVRAKAKALDDEARTLVKDLQKVEGTFSSKHRADMAAAFKRCINHRRNLFEDLATKLEEADEEGQEAQDLIDSQLAELSRQAEMVVNSLIDVIDDIVLERVDTEEGKVFCLSTRADFLRYMCSMSIGRAVVTWCKRAIEAYEQGFAFASKVVAPTHPARLAMALNYAVLYDDIVRSAYHSAQIARRVLETLKSMAQEIQFKESAEIVRTLNKNLRQWARNRLLDGSESAIAPHFMPIVFEPLTCVDEKPIALEPRMPESSRKESSVSSSVASDQDAQAQAALLDAGDVNLEEVTSDLVVDDRVKRAKEEILRSVDMLTDQQRRTFAVNVKRAIDQRRIALADLLSQQPRDFEELTELRYRTAMANSELVDICTEVVRFVEQQVLPRPSLSPESKVFFFALMGDYFRYLGEFQQDKSQEVLDECNSWYQRAWEIADAQLSAANGVRLNLALNMCVFYVEIKNARDNALAFGQSQSELAREDAAVLGSSEYARRILAQLEQNVGEWRAEQRSASLGERGRTKSAVQLETAFQSQTESIEQTLRSAPVVDDSQVERIIGMVGEFDRTVLGLFTGSHVLTPAEIDKLVEHMSQTTEACIALTESLESSRWKAASARDQVGLEAIEDMLIAVRSSLIDKLGSLHQRASTLAKNSTNDDVRVMLHMLCAHVRVHQARVAAPADRAQRASAALESLLEAVHSAEETFQAGHMRHVQAVIALLAAARALRVLDPTMVTFGEAALSNVAPAMRDHPVTGLLRSNVMELKSAVSGLNARSLESSRQARSMANLREHISALESARSATDVSTARSEERLNNVPSADFKAFSRTMTRVASSMPPSSRKSEEAAHDEEASMSDAVTVDTTQNSGDADDAFLRTQLSLTVVDELFARDGRLNAFVEELEACEPNDAGVQSDRFFLLLELLEASAEAHRMALGQLARKRFGASSAGNASAFQSVDEVDATVRARMASSIRSLTELCEGLASRATTAVARAVLTAIMGEAFGVLEPFVSRDECQASVLKALECHETAFEEVKRSLPAAHPVRLRLAGLYAQALSRLAGQHGTARTLLQHAVSDAQQDTSPHAASTQSRLMLRVLERALADMRPAVLANAEEQSELMRAAARHEQELGTLREQLTRVESAVKQHAQDEANRSRGELLSHVRSDARRMRVKQEERLTNEDDLAFIMEERRKLEDALREKDELLRRMLEEEHLRAARRSREELDPPPHEPGPRPSDAAAARAARGGGLAIKVPSAGPLLNVPGTGDTPKVVGRAGSVTPNPLTSTLGSPMVLPEQATRFFGELATSHGRTDTPSPPPESALKAELLSPSLLAPSLEPLDTLSRDNGNSNKPSAATPTSVERGASASAAALAAPGVTVETDEEQSEVSDVHSPMGLYARDQDMASELDTASQLSDGFAAQSIGEAASAAFDRTLGRSQSADRIRVPRERAPSVSDETHGVAMQALNRMFEGPVPSVDVSSARSDDSRENASARRRGSQQQRSPQQRSPSGASPAEVERILAAKEREFQAELEQQRAVARALQAQLRDAQRLVEELRAQVAAETDRSARAEGTARAQAERANLAAEQLERLQQERQALQVTSALSQAPSPAPQSALSKTPSSSSSIPDVAALGIEVPASFESLAQLKAFFQNKMAEQTSLLRNVDVDEEAIRLQQGGVLSHDQFEELEKERVACEDRKVALQIAYHDALRRDRRVQMPPATPGVPRRPSLPLVTPVPRRGSLDAASSLATSAAPPPQPPPPPPALPTIAVVTPAGGDSPELRGRTQTMASMYSISLRAPTPEGSERPPSALREAPSPPPVLVADSDVASPRSDLEIEPVGRERSRSFQVAELEPQLGAGASERRRPVSALPSESPDPRLRSSSLMTGSSQRSSLVTTPPPPPRDHSRSSVMNSLLLGTLGAAPPPALGDVESNASTRARSVSPMPMNASDAQDALPGSPSSAGSASPRGEAAADPTGPALVVIGPANERTVVPLTPEAASRVRAALAGDDEALAALSSVHVLGAAASVAAAPIGRPTPVRGVPVALMVQAPDAPVAAPVALMVQAPDAPVAAPVALMVQAPDAPAAAPVALTVQAPDAPVATPIALTVQPPESSAGANSGASSLEPVQTRPRTLSSMARSVDVQVPQTMRMMPVNAQRRSSADSAESAASQGPDSDSSDDDDAAAAGTPDDADSRPWKDLPNAGAARPTSQRFGIDRQLDMSATVQADADADGADANDDDNEYEQFRRQVLAERTEQQQREAERASPPSLDSPATPHTPVLQVVPSVTAAPSSTAAAAPPPRDPEPAPAPLQTTPVTRPVAIRAAPPTPPPSLPVVTAPVAQPSPAPMLAASLSPTHSDMSDSSDADDDTLEAINPAPHQYSRPPATLSSTLPASPWGNSVVPRSPVALAAQLRETLRASAPQSRESSPASLLAAASKHGRAPSPQPFFRAALGADAAPPTTTTTHSSSPPPLNERARSLDAQLRSDEPPFAHHHRDDDGASSPRGEPSIVASWSVAPSSAHSARATADAPNAIAGALRSVADAEPLHVAVPGLNLRALAGDAPNSASEVEIDVTSAAELDALPSEAEASPSDMNTSPREVDLSPREMDASPREHSAAPSDVDATPRASVPRHAEANVHTCPTPAAGDASVPVAAAHTPPEPGEPNVSARPAPSAREAHEREVVSMARALGEAMDSPTPGARSFLAELRSLESSPPTSPAAAAAAAHTYVERVVREYRSSPAKRRPMPEPLLPLKSPAMLQPTEWTITPKGVKGQRFGNALAPRARDYVARSSQELGNLLTLTTQLLTRPVAEQSPAVRRMLRAASPQRGAARRPESPKARVESAERQRPSSAERAPNGRAPPTRLEPPPMRRPQEQPRAKPQAQHFTRPSRAAQAPSPATKPRRRPVAPATAAAKLLSVDMIPKIEADLRRSDAAPALTAPRVHVDGQRLACAIQWDALDVTGQVIYSLLRTEYRKSLSPDNIVAARLLYSGRRREYVDVNLPPRSILSYRLLAHSKRTAPAQFEHSEPVVVALAWAGPSAPPPPPMHSPHSLHQQHQQSPDSMSPEPLDAATIERLSPSGSFVWSSASARSLGSAPTASGNDSGDGAGALPGLDAASDAVDSFDDMASVLSH